MFSVILKAFLERMAHLLRIDVSLERFIKELIACSWIDSKSANI